MDADVAALQRFAEVPYVIEAPATPTSLADHALAAMAAKSAPGKTSGKGLSAQSYQSIIAGVREMIAREIHPENGYRIEIFDTSAKDEVKEGSRIDKRLGMKGVRAELNSAMQGAFAFGLPVAKTAGTCIIVGFPHTTDIQGLLAAPVMGELGEHDLDTASAHKLFFYHELGHCLLGSSENRADVFAALMAVRDTKLDTAFPLLAAWRELTELTNDDPDDDHFMSRALWRVSAMREQLRRDPEFMALDAEGVAALAKTIADWYEFSPAERQEIKQFRHAVNAAVQKPVHYLKTENGWKPVSMEAWLADVQDRLPEMKRIVDLTARLMDGPADMDAFRPDIKRVRSVMADLAASGDPTAKTFLREMDRIPSKPKKDKGLGVKIPYDFQVAALHGRVIAYAETSETVCFAQDHLAYVVKDAQSGRTLRVGNILSGVEAAYSPRAGARAASDEKSAPAPR